jgi:predicted nucleic acid-binding protein
MQIASAVAERADYLVTRDRDGFSKSPVKIVSPRELYDELKK